MLESGCIGCVGRANGIMFCYCRCAEDAKFKLLYNIHEFMLTVFMFNSTHNCRKWALTRDKVNRQRYPSPCNV